MKLGVSEVRFPFHEYVGPELLGLPRKNRRELGVTEDSAQLIPDRHAQQDIDQTEIHPWPV